MEWQQLKNPEIQEFIKVNENHDVAELALKKAPNPLWPYALILAQIKVRKKAKIKAKDIYDTNGFIYPPNDVFEQASSSTCAKYKASLVSGERFIDLTAGCGIDAFYIGKACSHMILVEKNKNYADILRHNMGVLYQNTKKEILVINATAEEYLENVDTADLIYIDPQRREDARKGLFDLSLCSPNIVSLLGSIRSMKARVMIKASPFLDIEKGIKDLGAVSSVHVVQWQKDCKEVLYLLDGTHEGTIENVEVNAVDLHDDGSVKNSFRYMMADEKCLEIEYAMPKKYIYEPDPAFQKAGGFKSLAKHYHLHKLHPHTQLYTSNEKQHDFPGKCHEILDVLPVKSKALTVRKADLAVRNFPDTVKNLRKKLKINDGGAHRIYATTLCDDKKKLILCLK